MASDAVGMGPREPAEPEMAQLRIRAVMAHLSYEWRGMTIFLKIMRLPAISSPAPPRQWTVRFGRQGRFVRRFPQKH
jgi:hypothetical protein